MRAICPPPGRYASQSALHAMIARNKPPPCADDRTYPPLIRLESAESRPCSRFLPCSFTRMGLPAQGALAYPRRRNGSARLRRRSLPFLRPEIRPAPPSSLTPCGRRKERQLRADCARRPHDGNRRDSRRSSRWLQHRAYSSSLQGRLQKYYIMQYAAPAGARARETRKVYLRRNASRVVGRRGAIRCGREQSGPR